MSTVTRETIRLICLDFDGTSVDYGNGSVFLNRGIIAFLNQAADAGLNWCTNSGRVLEEQLQIIEASRAHGLAALPEALMCGESFLYLLEEGGYVSHAPWNEPAVKTLSDFHSEIRIRCAPELHDIALRYDAEKVLFDDAATAYLIPSTDSELLNACLREVDEVVRFLPDAFASRNGGWVFVGHRQFNKGRVLDAYLRERGYDAGETVAVGDNLNDLDMLDGSVCRHVGCPGDSLPEVKQVVRDAGGRVGDAHGPAGTIEVLTHFLFGG